MPFSSPIEEEIGSFFTRIMEISQPSLLIINNQIATKLEKSLSI